MDKLPGLDKRAVKITSLDDTEEEKIHWISKTPVERFAAIEIQRRLIYGEDPVTSRLQRILEIVELL